MAPVCAIGRDVCCWIFGAIPGASRKAVKTANNEHVCRGGTPLG